MTRIQVINDVSDFTVHLIARELGDVYEDPESSASGPSNIHQLYMGKVTDNHSVISRDSFENQVRRYRWHEEKV
jgi:hypothetical protein